MLEGNKLIGKFMNKDITSRVAEFPEHNRLVTLDGDTELSSYYIWEDVLYHDSWDWLMPVVRKIMSNEAKSEEGKRYKTIIIATMQSLDISSLYDATINYILWYNNDRSIKLEMKNIDFELLLEQKQQLNELTNELIADDQMNDLQMKSIAGILHLIDKLQDNAVEQGFTEKEVFENILENEEDEKEDRIEYKRLEKKYGDKWRGQ